MRSWLVATGVAAFVLAFVETPAHGQNCAGDFDFSRQVSADDVPEGIAFLFGKFGAFNDFTPVLKGIADVNRDGGFTVADIGGTVRLIETICGATPTVGTPLPTPTPSRTSSAGATTSSTPGTPTPTPTPVVSPTGSVTRPPTPVGHGPDCPLQSASVGTTAGALTVTDCVAAVAGGNRYVDGYELAVETPGVAVRVDVTSTEFTPYLLIRDPGGQFVTVEGTPPIEFVATSSSPYAIFLTSAPGSISDLGGYGLSVSTRACPVPLALALPQNGELTADDCPEPAVPSVGSQLNPADQFFITVTDSEVPKNIRLQMTVISGDVDPEFAVIGPDGYELLYAAADNLVIGEDDLNEDARFLALQPGRYTVIVSGLGGLGKYRIAPVTQPQCRTKALPALGDVTRAQVSGKLFGAISGPNSSSCAAPLRPPASDVDAPEPGSPSDVYTFDASAGDVVSFMLDSDDDPYLFVLGPVDCSRAGAGCVPKMLLATDDDSGELGGSSAQLAATIVHPGTYLLIVANAAPLFPPEDGDEGEEVSYTLFTQRCTSRGTLTLNGAVRSASFDAFSCRGSGGVPVASYAFEGTSGNFAAASVMGNTFDAFVRIVGPDGAVIQNDNDPFAPGSANAFVGRVMASTGTYFVEASASTAQDAPSLSSPVAYSVGVRSCPLAVGNTGAVNGSLTAADCTLPNGRRYDVYRFDGPADPQRPDVLSVRVPEGTCAAALLTSGMQVPVDQCATGVFELPLLPGRSGLIVAGATAGTGGPYVLDVARCGSTLVGFGTSTAGVLSGGDCAAADGLQAQWFFARAPTGLVTFLSNGVLGNASAEFPLDVRLTDSFGAFPAGEGGGFADSAELMYSFGSDLGLLMRIQSASGSDTGVFRVTVNAGERRQ